MKLRRCRYCHYSYLMYSQHAFNLNNSSVPAWQKKVLLWRQHCPWMSAQTCLSGRCQRQPMCQANAQSFVDLTIKAWTGCNLKNSPLGLATAITFLLKILESCRTKKCHFTDCVFSSWGCERSRVLENAPVGWKTICLYSRVSAVRADLGASLKCVSPQLSEQAGVHWASRVKRLCAHILSGYCGSRYSTKGKKTLTTSLRPLAVCWLWVT